MRLKLLFMLLKYALFQTGEMEHFKSPARQLSGRGFILSVMPFDDP